MGISFFAHGLRSSLLFAGILATTAAAWGQAVYLPVQFQFGRYGEIYYGGSNGTFVANPYLFVPEYNRNAALGNSYGPADSRGLPSPYTPGVAAVAQTMNWPSPNYRPTEYHVPYSMYKPLIYSDLEPGVDVGERGFTIDDARNEAYFNLPRYLSGPDAGKPAELAVTEPTGPIHPATREQEAKAKQAKALQLIHWAKAEHATGKNPKLVETLLQLAAKYDVPAVAKARADMK